MPKRRRCGYQSHPGVTPCPGPVVWLTTHVAVCGRCGALWWWAPRAAPARRWQLCAAGEFATSEAAYELARTLLDYHAPEGV